MKKLISIIICLGLAMALWAAGDPLPPMLKIACDRETAAVGETLHFKFMPENATNPQVTELLVMLPTVDSYLSLGKTDNYTPQETGDFYFVARMRCDEADEVQSPFVHIIIKDKPDAEQVTIRLKGNKNVWTAPYLMFGDGRFFANFLLTGTEGEYNFWEASVYTAPLTFTISQDGYEGDYYAGTLTTLPYTISQPGTYCLTTANLNGKANINRDNVYVYTTTEDSYDTANGDNTGRQAGKLFPMICDDLDHHILYTDLEGKADDELRQAVMDITNKGKRVTSYQSLREAYAISDYREFGIIWDMYSNRAGTYRYAEGESGGSESEDRADYNREHSLVKSYWGHDNASCIPAFSDIVHIVPTNGYVNTCRSTYPYGEVGAATQVFGNGSKKGTSNFGGYDGVVFEPIDEYKGDFARIYFYMLTCYGNLDYTHNEHGQVTFYFDGERSQFTAYGQSLMMKWARQDEVSDKECSRNDAIQSVQGNRNPFVDLPNLAEYIWGEHTGVPYSFDDHYLTTSLANTESSSQIRAWKHCGTIFIDCHAAQANIEVLSITGQTICSVRITGPQMHTMRIGTGVNIIKATMPDGSITVIKVM